MSSELPNLGAVFWPVGTGDSTTIVVSDEIMMQVDLHDLAKADDDDTHEVPIVDLLADALPRGTDGKPYLAVFVLTHADKDHCSGFKELLDRVTIGELWATPRLWREFDDPDAPELCKDAKAFQEESIRRVEATKKAVAKGKDPDSGDRILVVGYDTDHDEHAYSELPDRFLATPGDSITKLDGEDLRGRFEAFIHAPFKDDCAEARNDTSLSMQITLTEDGGRNGKMLLFGDLAHDTIMKIFNYSEAKQRENYLEWDLLLAPHHCSKKVMYVREDGRDVLKNDVLDAFERHAREGAVIVSSSCPIPSKDVDGNNPPHRKAADRYREIVDSGNFLCTMEWPSEDDPSSIVFAVDSAGGRIVSDDAAELSAKAAVMEAVAKRHRSLVAVAAAASSAGRLAAEKVGGGSAGTDVQSGPERVRDAVAASRGTKNAPATTVGFGSD
ncbi:hypothetical protein AB0K60_30560 [Thermopolyspora sp. NPDC052614]|uniref:hypothetical protein n=1 Tax=Thermopolyspora sp. NPDC052614 TaxID=3155682 RepID=UPI00342BAA37